MINSKRLSGRRFVQQARPIRMVYSWNHPLHCTVNTLELSSFREGTMARRRIAGVAVPSALPSLGWGWLLPISRVGVQASLLSCFFPRVFIFFFNFLL